MGELLMRDTGTVIPFRPAPDRGERPGRRSRAVAADGRFGEILLFTGVRYERMPEPDPAPAVRGRSGSGRRRRS